MRNAAFFILVFISCFSSLDVYTQERPDIWIEYEKEMDNFEEYYRQKLLKDRCYIDIVITTDSIIISYLSSKTHNPIQVHTAVLENDCEEFKYFDYFNNRGLIICRKYCSNYCPKNENNLTPIYYERFEYDSKNRLKIHTFQLSTPMTIKIVYTYKKGKRHIKEYARINITDFWK